MSPFILGLKHRIRYCAPVYLELSCSGKSIQYDPKNRYIVTVRDLGEYAHIFLSINYCVLVTMPKLFSKLLRQIQRVRSPMLKLPLGINFFDTADVYSLGTSEEILGRALKDFAKRDRVGMFY